MKRVFFDENVPRPIIKLITDDSQQLSSISKEGWEGIQNGELIARMIEGGWEVFVTADKNIRYQQNIKERGIAIVELPTNRLPVLKKITAEIAEAIRTIRSNDYLQPGI